MLENFSCTAQKALTLAEALAFEFHHPSVGSEHLLLALLKMDDNVISSYLQKLDIKYKTFSDKIRLLYEHSKEDILYVQYSFDLKEVLEEAKNIAKKNKDEIISIDYLSLGLLSRKNVATEILHKLNVDISSIIKMLNDNKFHKSELANIMDLHLLGLNNKDPLIGREKELVELIYSLSRRNKPNAILIGDPGVGKTAIVEELAKRLINNEVDTLSGKYIYELDLASTVSGTKYRGEFEDKLKKIIRKVKEDGHAILFIDEIHNVVKAGGAEGAIDASNILKPYLARADIQVIGATTKEEFNATFEKDKALKRRFQLINVNESTKEETLDILKHIKPIYEDYYHLTIEDYLLDLICNLSDQYILNQKFPDKAIDLLDNSCVASQDKLTLKDIEKTITNIYRIDIHQEFKEGLLKDNLNRIYSQDSMKKELINALKNDAHSLLFVGPVGVGKMLTAKVIADTFYQSEYVHLNGETLNDYNAITKLLSRSLLNVTESPSEFVKQIKDNPNTLIVFENVDKTNNETLDFFYNLYNKGYFFDFYGNKVLTSNCKFIFTVTTNSLHQFDLLTSKIENEDLDEKELKKRLGYSFLSIIDDVIHFEYLDDKAITSIASHFIQTHNRNNQFDLDSLQEDLPFINEGAMNGGDAVIEQAKMFLKNSAKKKIKIN